MSDPAVTQLADCIAQIAEQLSDTALGPWSVDYRAGYIAGAMTALGLADIIWRGSDVHDLDSADATHLGRRLVMRERP